MRLKNDSIVAGCCNGSDNIGRMWGNAVNRECGRNGASENTGVASKEEENGWTDNASSCRLE